MNETNLSSCIKLERIRLAFDLHFSRSLSDSSELSEKLIALKSLCIKNFKAIKGFELCSKMVEMAVIETASENSSSWVSTSVFRH